MTGDSAPSATVEVATLELGAGDQVQVAAGCTIPVDGELLVMAEMLDGGHLVAGGAPAIEQALVGGRAIAVGVGKNDHGIGWIRLMSQADRTSCRPPKRASVPR